MIIDKLPKRLGEIEKVYIDPPIASGENLVYSGSAQGPVITDTNPQYYITSGDITATDVGEYTIQWTLKNTKRMAWSDTSTDPKTFTYKINKKRVIPPTISSTEVTYNRQAQTIPYTDSSDKDWYIVNESSHTNVGSYTALVSLKDGISGENVIWDDTGDTATKTYNFTIKKKLVKKPRVGSERSFVYNGHDQGPTITMDGGDIIELDWININYKVGTRTTNAHANANDYTLIISLKDPSPANFSWEDGTQDNMEYPFTIEKAAISAPVVSGLSFTYTGASQGPTRSGVDTTKCSVSGSTVGTSAGNYSFSISFKSSYSGNYKWDDTGNSDPRVYNWSIAKKKVTPPTVSVGSYTYNGYAQGPSITHSSDSGWYSVSGASYKYPGSFTLTVSLNNGTSGTNVTWSDGTAANKTYGYTINKLTYGSIFPTDWQYSTPMGKTLRNGTSITTDSSYPNSPSYWSKVEGPFLIVKGFVNSNQTYVRVGDDYGFYGAWFGVRLSRTDEAAALFNAISAEYPGTGCLLLQFYNVNDEYIYDILIDSNYLYYHFKVDISGINSDVTYWTGTTSGPNKPSTDFSKTKILRELSGLWYDSTSRVWYSGSGEHFPRLHVNLL